MISIELDNITKSFENTRAIDGLSLRFEPGTLHGIIGPDGAGKTTLLRLVGGLLKPGSGRILYKSGPNPAAFEEVRANLAYMPARPSLYADLSIREHLEFFKSLYQLPRDEYAAKSKRLLEITRLERFTERKVGELSGGMYKKLGLMCALLQSPTILLLDEPTNGVDPISRREFWELLYQLLEQNILILISTAYMDEAERCGMVHLIDSGRLIASGEPKEILRKEKAGTFDELFLRSAKK
ncbi:MAG TPA: ABC transporter ATP-binding protein [Elusimicrobia bacterium]|nr:MAG: ABC transporter ATP-binding protein [Elusimicrobia bacterium RIFOXYA12_FULL_49_49]OGS15235.1 MAG: ABC transporter ATP-binding protein [Elusimicrobia bacterium RIFOXYA2_FULL_47_53]OGS25910.1 MAG: ABC transporter ATP-binding protein [Elusimicrobia bacterium RIFOXYB12_FULL_50_12]OGS30286.1 MAG: ABC transporter ATP-binding protein [Elusimicrobia bacterium RIFOXYB2_FULL_46_23]HBU70431.1 ABC transporter ATP-binding protein [Elusimicrobiota bacterium]